MEDTDSSDFLSSCDSLYSADSTAVSGGEDTSYVDFNVFLSGGLEEATKAKQDLDNEIMIPNSRLSSSDHPVLIRLENEYQARRSHWHHRSGRYFGYEQEIAGRISYSSQTALTCRGAKLGSRNGDEPLKHCVCHEEANHGSPHGLKRQRTQEAALPTEWWKDRQQQDCAVSEGDRIFAQKCQELQGFIKPLTDLLNGLKKGRYERGLSTFQQSVAMDRIQRIIGVLQKPQMGERYLGTLLQVEMMLKIWFPSVTSSSSASSSSDCEMEEPQYKVAKHPNVDRSDATSCPSSEGHSPNSHAEENPVPSPAVTHSHSDCVCCKDQTHIQTPMNLTWMHPTPVANPSLGHVDLNHLNRAFGQEIFGLNTNNCGVILFLHSNPASSSTSPRPASTMQTENPPPAIRRHGGAEVTKDKEPPRSRSAPATLPASGRSGLRDTGSLSCSLSHILVCSPRPVGENT